MKPNPGLGESSLGADVYLGASRNGVEQAFFSTQPLDYYRIESWLPSPSLSHVPVPALVTGRPSPVARRPSPVTRRLSCHPHLPPLLGMLSKPLRRSLRMTTLRVRWQPRPRSSIKGCKTKARPSENSGAAPGSRALREWE